MFGARKAPKLALLLLLVGVAAAVWQRRKALPAAPSAAPTWPPLDTTKTPRPFVATTPEPATEPVVEPTVVEADDEAEPEGEQRWVAPVDGQCPDGYPVKANDNSRIFHVPGGRFYARTVPERCYATAEDAAADGYRRAKA